MFDFLLPPPPGNWDFENDYKIYAKLAAPQPLTLEPVGCEFANYSRRKTLNRSIRDDEDLQFALIGTDIDNDDVDFVEEDEPYDLLHRDPLKWKEQDHYQVLGLSSKRWEATDDDIKRAYRRKVLKHHPDKKGSTHKDLKKGLKDDSFFKCIQRAWEVLSEPEKRRQWDAVDPTFDEAIPHIKAEGDFFDIYSNIFHSSSRFSVIQPVPTLGDLNSQKENVESFYIFWFNFDSWRTFEGLDEETSESATSREEKRWIDRKNKAARQKRKKEDNARTNKLVEQAFKLDPRIRMFKDAEKEAKEAKKLEKGRAAREAEEENQRKVDEEKKEAERVAAEAKLLKENEKALKEERKKIIKKEKKGIKAALKSLLENTEDSIKLATAVKLESVFENLNESPDYESFRLELESADSFEQLFTILESKFNKLNNILQDQKQSQESLKIKKALSTLNLKKPEEKKQPFSPKETATLIKAVKTLPGGISQRWEKIAEYVNLHGGEEGETAAMKKGRERSADDCIKMSKIVQQGAASQDRTLIQQAASRKTPGAYTKEKEPEVVVASETGGGKSTWDDADQALLEQCLRKFPATQFREKPADRWEKIALEMPGKRAKDIKKRVKEQQDALKKPAKEVPIAAPIVQPKFLIVEEGKGGGGWSADEQVILEASLRKFPAADFRERPGDRWEKIAGELNGKTKKDVKSRVKELQEMVKSKKK